MATTFTAENATEALILEQALAYARQLHRTAGEAPDGQVLRWKNWCQFIFPLFCEGAPTTLCQIKSQTHGGLSPRPSDHTAGRSSRSD